MARVTLRGTLIGVTFVLSTAVRAKAGDVDDENEFREDVIWCEDALAHLRECCPSFDPTLVRCHYHDLESDSGGCGTQPTWDKEAPALSIDESRCIEDRSCAALVDSGVCSRAQSATPYTHKSYYDPGSGGGCSSSSSQAYRPAGTYDDPNVHPPVCP